MALDSTPQLDNRYARKRRSTRARLLKAGHDIMAEVGVDQAKVSEITNAADLGFGTFYNYFPTKDVLAGEVLDCMIHDCGVRSELATRELANSDPAAIIPVSIRLVIREAAATPIWRWWALRPDLLVDRVRDGFAEFATRDLRHGVEHGFLHLSHEDLDQGWALACWMIVGGIHDIVVGNRPLASDAFVSSAIARVWGYDSEAAQRVSTLPLPPFGPASIDWNFTLSGD